MLQAIIAVLNSLVKPDWTYVSIEPDEESQKVDIQWWDDDENLQVFQVKSSMNNFDKSNILEMLKELTDGCPDASKFTLVLIGTYSGETKKFFNKFQNHTAADFGQKYVSIAAFTDKITIDFKALDVPALDGFIAHKVHEFLFSRDFDVAPQTISLIALGLQAQFTRFANDGQKVSKTEFEAQILNWIKFNYPNKLKSAKGRLSVSFYFRMEDNDSGVLEKEIGLTFLDELACIKDAKIKLGELFHQIDAIKLPPKKEVPDYLNPNRVNTFAYVSILDSTFAGYEPDDISRLSELSSSLVGIQIPGDFFNVGEVKKTKMSYSLTDMFSGPKYLGTETEVKKRNLLGDFVYQLNELEELLACWQELQTYRIIPLILKNTGDTLNENIELQLKIPDTVNVLLATNFPCLSYSGNMELFAREGGLAELCFQHTKDSQVKEYDHRRIKPFYLPMPSVFGISGRDHSAELESTLKRVFDYEVFNDVPGFRMLACTFKSLKPQDKMALPSYLLIKHDGPFSINYTIKSDQSSGHQGTLQIQTK